MGVEKKIKLFFDIIVNIKHWDTPLPAAGHGEKKRLGTSVLDSGPRLRLQQEKTGIKDVTAEALTGAQKSKVKLP